MSLKESSNIKLPVLDPNFRKMLTPSPTNTNWTCANHGKEFEYYCHNCKKYVCSLCPKNISSPHHWEKIAKLVKRKRFIFPQKSEEIKKKAIPKIQKSRMDVHRVKVRTEKSNSEKIQFLKEKKESVISAVSAVFDHCILTMQHKLSQSRQKLDNVASQLKHISEDLGELAEMMEKQSGTFSSLFTSDFEVLETEREAEQKITQSNLLALHPFTNKWKSTVELNLHELIANIQNVTASIILPHDPYKIQTAETTSFTHGKDAPINISAVTGKQVWCKSKKGSIDLLTSEGQKVKSISCKCNYVVAVDDKTLVVTNVASQKIEMVTQDNEVVLLKNTSPLYPTFIGRSLDGGVLVSLIDKPTFDVTDYSKRMVQHINVNGTVNKSYEYEEDDQTPLFVYPESVAQNRNTDICVINFNSETTGHLCVLYAKTGKVHFTYKGQSDSEHLFFPTDVCCDSNCNIFISDSVNKSIHLLNSNGQFVKYVLPKAEISAMCMSIHNDNLWLGCEKGEIKVLSLTN